MFPLGQNIPNWVFAWNTPLLCGRRMDPMWSHCVSLFRSKRGSRWPSVASYLAAVVIELDQEVLGFTGYNSLWTQSVNKAGLSTSPMGTCFCISLTKRVGHHALVTLGFPSRFCVLILSFQKSSLKKIHPTMTNIWIKTKPDSFQGSWADHMYLEPEFSPSSWTDLIQI